MRRVKERGRICSRRVLLSVLIIAVFGHGCTWSAVSGRYDPTTASQYLEQGDVALAAGDLRKATAAYKLSCELAVSSECLVGRGVVAARDGVFEDAEQLFNEALSIAPSDAYALGNLGVLAARSGQPYRAIEFYERALISDPEAFEFRNNLAVELLRVNGPIVRERAQQLLEQAASIVEHVRVKENLSKISRSSQ